MTTQPQPEAPDALRLAEIIKQFGGASAYQAAAELLRLHAECEALRKSLALVQQHHATAWNRGHTMGMAANRQIAREAQEAVARDAWGNTQLTEALLAAEAECETLRVERDALRAATGGRMGYFDDEVGKLRAECEALRADAERYRWLRGTGEYFTGDMDEDGFTEYSVFFWTASPTLDSAIDAARAAIKEQPNDH